MWLQNSFFNLELVVLSGFQCSPHICMGFLSDFLPLPQTAARWIAYELPLGVNDCVHDAQRSTGILSGVYSSTLLLVFLGYAPDPLWHWLGYRLQKWINESYYWIHFYDWWYDKCAVIWEIPSLQKMEVENLKYSPI